MALLTAEERSRLARQAALARVGTAATKPQRALRTWAVFRWRMKNGGGLVKGTASNRNQTRGQSECRGIPCAAGAARAGWRAPDLRF
jgi:hypothetical protein